MDDAEHLMRRVIDACTACECCRYTMDTNGLLFPEIYRLWDWEKETGERFTPEERRRLADLCNYCALCPCPDIREDIITAKTLFIDRDGLAPGIRTLEDMERVGKLCGVAPRLSNLLMQGRITGLLIPALPIRPVPARPGGKSAHNLAHGQLALGAPIIFPGRQLTAGSHFDLTKIRMGTTFFQS